MFTFPNRKILLPFFLLLLGLILGISVVLNPTGTLFILLALLVAFLIFFFPGLFLIGFFFSLPYLPAMNLSIGFDLSLGRVLILFLFLGWILCSLVKKSFKLPLRATGIFLILFLIWIAGSYLYSPITDRTLRKILVFYSIFPLFFISYGIFRERGKQFILKVFKAAGAGSFFVILFGILQFSAQFFLGSQLIINFYSNHLAPFLWGKTVALAVERNPSWFFDAGFRDLLRAFSTFPDPHMLSYFLAFAVPLLFAFGFFLKGKIKFIYLLMALLGLFVEFLTFSRGGYLGFFSALFFVLIVLSFRISRRKKKKVFWGGLIVGLLLPFLLLSSNPVSKRIASIFNIYEGSNQGRLAIWEEAFDLFKDNPLLGVGLGAYSYEIKPSADYREPIYAHNLYLEFLAEIGIPGLVFWLGIMFSAFRTLFRKYLKDKNDKLGVISLALSSSLIWFSVHSLFEMPVYSPVILSLLALTFAFAAYLENKKISNKIKI